MADEFDPAEFTAFKEKFSPDEFAQFKAGAGSSAGTPSQSLSWSDVPGKALENLPNSAAQFGKDLIHPFLHPVETAQAVGNIGAGALRKMSQSQAVMPGPLGIVQQAGRFIPQEKEKYVDAVGQFLKDRYGSADAIKATLANDPVGAMADFATALTGGELAAARAPGVLGKMGQIAGTVGRAVDPLTIPIKGAEYAGKGAAGLIGGLGTHTGAESLKRAYAAGREGGQAADTFAAHMRGKAPLEDVVDDARNAVLQIRKERSAEYKAGMKDVGADTKVLNFDKIDDALVEIAGNQTFKGQVLNQKTQAIRQEIGEAVRDWKALDPVEYHTAEGLDALKRKIGDIREATQYGTPERRVADQVYNAIKRTIVAQAPGYAKTMKGYEEASKQIKELERTLSLNPNASVDTALRKLQSVLRNNVNTNYGQRAKLVEYLSNAGAPHLMEALAGQALNAWVPRGLAKLVGTEILMHAITKGIGAGAAGILAGPAGVAATLPFMSPRLMGEAAYLAGKGSRYMPGRRTGQASFQPGRMASQPRPAMSTAEQETAPPSFNDRWSSLDVGRKTGGRSPPPWWVKATARDLERRLGGRIKGYADGGDIGPFVESEQDKLARTMTHRS